MSALSDANGNGTLLADAPPSVSRRALMRDSLPPIYREADFAMRLVGALEGVLDPIFALLDSLPANFSADYASRPAVDLLAAWIGVELDEALELDARREVVRMGAELHRWRGTARGLELALKLTFPDLPIRVADDGGVHWSSDGEPAEPRRAHFTVFVERALAAERLAAVARCIDHHKPMHCTYRLRSRKRSDAGE